MNKRNVSFGTPGGSALMVTFAVLCLVVFAVLSLSTAQADKRLSEVSADAVRQYYEADREANRILSQIRKGSIPAGVETEEGICRYSCRISDTRTLFVEVRVNGSDYEILRWQEEYTADWEPDTSLDVWSGN